MKHIYVEMPDKIYKVPVSIVADQIKSQYPEDYADGLEPDDEDVLDWAQNNMNWEDVEPHAIIEKELSPTIDRQEYWVNGELEIR